MRVTGATDMVFAQGCDISEPGPPGLRVGTLSIILAPHSAAGSGKWHHLRAQAYSSGIQCFLCNSEEQMCKVWSVADF